MDLLHPLMSPEEFDELMGESSLNGKQSIPLSAQKDKMWLNHRQLFNPY